MYFIKELIPWIKSARIGKPVSDDGENISLFGEVTVKVNALVKNVIRRFRSLATIETATKLKITLGPYISDHGGVNAALIDANGNFHINAWGLHVKDEPSVDRRQVPDLVMSYEFARSSEIGLIYNLLRQVYLLDLVGKPKKASDDYYNDGHLAVTYGEAFDFTDEQMTWGLTPSPVYVPDTSNNPDPPLIKWPAMTPEQACILKCGLSALTGKRGVALAADSPLLTEKIRFPITARQARVPG
jgi:hypothetical protein